MDLKNKPMSFYISEFSEKHLDEVSELETLCFSNPISKNNLKALLLEGIGKGFVSVDTECGNIAAYGGVIIAGGEAQILNIATHPNYRRLGHGRIIVESILEYSLENGAEYVTLEVRENNIAAIALYGKLGFYPVGRIKGYYKTPTEDALILKKELCHL